MTEMNCIAIPKGGQHHSILHERHRPVRRSDFLDLRMLGEFQSILDIYTQISHCVLDLGVTEQDLDRTEISG